MKHIEVVAAIILWNGKILCMQRNAGKYHYVSYKYEFPGGKIEPGESNIEALTRELREEMDIEVEISDKDYFLTVHHDYPDFSITMHSYLCRVSNNCFTRKEHAAHQWLDKSELHTLDWASADIPIVKKLEGSVLA